MRATHFLDSRLKRHFIVQNINKTRFQNYY